MNGPEIFTFTLDAVPRAVHALLTRAEKTLADIDLFVYHQANRRILAAGKRLAPQDTGLAASVGLKTLPVFRKLKLGLFFTGDEETGVTIHETVKELDAGPIAAQRAFAIGPEDDAGAVGGEGTLRVAAEFSKKGLPLVCIPKTIDNDIGGTEVTFGFDTAVTTATEAIDKLHTTAEAHHRVMVLEVMGRDAGFIALHAGVSGGADVILIPEIPFKYEAVVRKVNERVERGMLFSIVVVSEGAKPVTGEQVFSRAGDEIYTPRLGGIGHRVGEYIEDQGFETRVTVLGHVQRGGTPSPFDRWLATRYGAAAVRLAAQGKYNRMVSLQAARITDVSIEEAIAVPKRVDINDDAVLTARGMSISFGDE